MQNNKYLFYRIALITLEVPIVMYAQKVITETHLPMVVNHVPVHQSQKIMLNLVKLILTGN